MLWGKLCSASRNSKIAADNTIIIIRKIYKIFQCIHTVYSEYN